MKSHLRSMAKRKVSDFLLREEGMVGNRSAFATAALVSTTALAMTLLVVPDALADCDDGAECPDGDKRYCCPTGVPGKWVCLKFKNHSDCEWAG